MKRLTLAKGLAGMDGKELLCAMSFDQEEVLQTIVTKALFRALADVDSEKFEFTVNLDLKPIPQEEWDKETQILGAPELNETIN